MSLVSVIIGCSQCHVVVLHKACGVCGHINQQPFVSLTAALQRSWQPLTPWLHISSHPKQPLGTQAGGNQHPSRQQQEHTGTHADGHAPAAELEATAQMQQSLKQLQT
jgi:hypothetical protein